MKFLTYFGSPSCPACRQMKPTINNQQIQDLIKSKGYNFREIDTNENSDIAKEYDVGSIPQIVISEVENGKFKEIKRVKGFKTVEQLTKILNE